MGYTKQTWSDGSGGGTPITAARLGHVEDGLEAAAALADLVPPVERFGRMAQATKIVTTMQSGHGYTQTGTGTTQLNDTADKISGAQSAWVQSAGAGGQCNLRRYAQAANIGDTTGKALRLRIKVDNLVNLNELTFIIGKNSIADAWKFSYIVGGGSPYLLEGEWATIVLSWANAAVDSGTPLRTDPSDISCQVFDNTTGQLVKLHVQSIELVPNGHPSYPNGLVSICFDDAYSPPRDLAWTKLDSLGYPGSLYVIGDYLGTGGRLTLADLHTRHERYGWEVACHATTGTIHATTQTGLTAAALHADLSGQRAYMEGQGFRGASGYAYPLGIFGKTSDNSPTLDITRRYMSYARTTHGRTTETLPPADPFRLRAYSGIGSAAGGITATTIAGTNGVLEKAKLEGAWVILVFHNIVTTTPASTSECLQTDFNTIIDKISSQGMPVLTVMDALRAVSA